MANSPLNPGRNNRDGQRRSLRELIEPGNGVGGMTPQTAPDSVEEDPWGDPKEDTKDSIERTRILATLHREQEEHREKSPSSEPLEEEDPALIAEVQEENEKLQSIVVELQQLLDETAAAPAEDAWAEREAEYEAMLEDKSETIRRLNAEIKELEVQREGGGEAAGDQPAGIDRAELVAFSDEMERERVALQQQDKQLEAERMQLREDEESMMRQMREMEMQMSKDRAELARQRNELQRLHSEIRHELELAQRDAEVNARLRLLQRGRQSSGEDESEAPTKPAAKATKKTQQGTQKVQRPTKETGLFRRLFGGDK